MPGPEARPRRQSPHRTRLQRGFTLALLMIFALLAVPLRSYVQPLIIMSAIPFGLVGTVWGHVFLGLNVSIMSMFGLVALTGVVVNDSLIMADFINRARDVHADVGRLARQAGGVPTDRRDFETASLALAVREAGVHHFRPILLTSLTTFFGLAPLMWNRSLDASFMVPMAVSLGFGGAVRDADHAGVGADGVHDPRRRRPDDVAGLRRPASRRRCRRPGGARPRCRRP